MEGLEEEGDKSHLSDLGCNSPSPLAFLNLHVVLFCFFMLTGCQSKFWLMLWMEMVCSSAVRKVVLNNNTECF